MRGADFESGAAYIETEFENVKLAWAAEQGHREYLWNMLFPLSAACDPREASARHHNPS